MNASPLSDEAVEVVLREKDGGDQSNDHRRESERNDGFEEGETGSLVLYQERFTKVEPLNDGPEPLFGTPDTRTCRRSDVESATVTVQV